MGNKTMTPVNNIDCCIYIMPIAINCQGKLVSISVR